MKKSNPLAGLIANYGDSDEDSDDGAANHSYAVNDRSIHRNAPVTTQDYMSSNTAAIHAPPITHCPWSACYDENSGFTYYWNQHTNAVTWEAPPEYLLALKLAQQQLHTSGSTEVSAEEWQLYQQALAEKQNSQNKVIAKTTTVKSSKKTDKANVSTLDKSNRTNKKRAASDDEGKIELITSYHNSDSESNDESETVVKAKNKPTPPKPTIKPEKVPPQKNPHKKLKSNKQIVEYGPAMPPNMNSTYPTPIGPELPSDLKSGNVPESSKNEAKKPDSKEVEDKIPAVSNDNEDSQDETELLKQLKDKAELLQKLGGELPSELQQIIKDETNSVNLSPKTNDDTKDKNLDIDDLLQEIEKKEFVKSTQKTESSKDAQINSESEGNSPKGNGEETLGEIKCLFPSSKNINEQAVETLFPSSTNVEEAVSDAKPESPKTMTAEKKENLYLLDSSEPIENTNRKKLRICNSVLPDRKKVERTDTPAYTTKYSQFIEGFSSERTGLGFSKDEDVSDSPKNTISYGNGLTFTKGEILNEEKKDEDLDDLTDLIEAKLKYLNELQPCTLTPVQEMLIQMQTLGSAFRAGALRGAYWRRWAEGAGAALARHEAAAAPPGWTCAFQRSEGRYRYRREADGLEQWEYPAVADTDMDISTTPPHPGIESKEEQTPPLPLRQSSPPAMRSTTPPPPAWLDPPPPPAWHDPPPPGCDDAPPPLPPEPKKEIGDELMSFYSDIAELEKQSVPSPATTASNSPEPVLSDVRERARDRESKSIKKKSKVKISTLMGLKHKSVSSLVAKWQQVADEINSD